MKVVTKVVIAATTAFLLVPALASGAHAAEATNLELSPTSVAPGSTVTVTATFVATATTDDVGLQLPAELVGDAFWSAISSDPVRICIVNDPDDGGAGCLWNSATIGDTLTITATLTVPASTPVGDYDISTVSSISPTELTETLVVSSGGPATPGDPDQALDTLADTGPTASASATFGLIAFGLLAAGTVLVSRFRKAPSTTS